MKKFKTKVVGLVALASVIVAACGTPISSVNAQHDWSSYEVFTNQNNSWRSVSFQTQSFDESKFAGKATRSAQDEGQRGPATFTDNDTGKVINTVYEWFDSNGTNSYSYYGWFREDSTGKWFVDASGWYPKNQWLLIGNTWYWFDENGYIPNKEGWYYCGDA